MVQTNKKGLGDCSFQDFLNMFFKDIFKPIPPIYNLIVATLWRHLGHIEIDKVKVVHYCAEVIDHLSNQ